MNDNNRISLCLDVGITHTRAWGFRSGEIIARAKALEGIRGSAGRQDRTPALNAIANVISECRLKIKELENGTPLDRISAAGMVTSELGPFPVDHIQGPAGITQLSENVVDKGYLKDLQAHLLLVPGIRFGSAGEDDASDAIRGEETLVMGLLARGSLGPGDALLNLGSHWKLIGINAKSEIVESYTGIGGELMLAVSRETILKNILPDERPSRLISASLRKGRERGARYGLDRTLFLSRLDSQRRNATSDQIYWQLAGAVIEDSLRGLRQRLQQFKRVGITGYPPLVEAWAEVLSEIGIEPQSISEIEVELSFCTGLERIAAYRYQ